MPDTIRLRDEVSLIKGIGGKKKEHLGSGTLPSVSCVRVQYGGGKRKIQCPPGGPESFLPESGAVSCHVLTKVHPDTREKRLEGAEVF